MYPGYVGLTVQDIISLIDVKLTKNRFVQVKKKYLKMFSEMC